MKSMYFSLVYSKLIYCVTIWGSTVDSQLNRVQIAQNRVFRSMMKLRKYDSVREIYVNLKILRFKQIFEFFSALLIFKFSNLSYSKAVFRRVNEVHGRITRAAEYDIFLITPRISQVLNSAIYKCPLYYNSLPNYIKQSNSINEFKGKLKFYILQTYQ